MSALPRTPLSQQSEHKVSRFVAVKDTFSVERQFNETTLAKSVASPYSSFKIPKPIQFLEKLATKEDSPKRSHLYNQVKPLKLKITTNVTPLIPKKAFQLACPHQNNNLIFRETIKQNNEVFKKRYPFNDLVDRTIFGPNSLAKVLSPLNDAEKSLDYINHRISKLD